MVESSVLINTTLQLNIEERAKRVLTFGDFPPDVLYGHAMNMKAQLDNLLKNNQRTPEELCALYRRLVLTSGTQVIPALRSAKQAKMEESLMKQLTQANASYRELLAKLSSQQNASNIPGLSNPVSSIQSKPSVVTYQGFQPTQPKATMTVLPGFSGYPSLTSTDPVIGAPVVTGMQSSYPQMPSTSSALSPQIQVQSLRTVICPLEIVASFLRSSNDNTFRKVETCAILAGEERQGQLHITTLIFPQQTGSRDQCSMIDEVELFEVQIEKSVMTLGWIHTHPQFVSFAKFTCKDLFLSSVDVHNQLGYQLQLPEAVAIVYSPIVGQPGYKTFRVRDQFIPALKQCKQTGFHKHATNGEREFEECTHVQYTQGSRYEVIDLRK